MTTPDGRVMKWWWPPQGTNGRLVIDTLGRLVSIGTMMLMVCSVDDPTAPTWFWWFIFVFFICLTVLVCSYAYDRFNWSDDER